MEERELKTILESVLFISSEPLSLDKLREVLEAAERGKILEALDAIREDFIAQGHGFQIVETGGGYQMTTIPESAPWVKRLEKIRTSSKLSKAALEVLAVIAYRQGVTRPEIEAIRGVDCGGVVKSLMERRLVRIIGRKETVGRPLVYGTSKEFLLAFGLKDLSELPSLKEFKELTENGTETAYPPAVPPESVGPSPVLSAPSFGSPELASDG